MLLRPWVSIFKVVGVLHKVSIRPHAICAPRLSMIGSSSARAAHDHSDRTGCQMLIKPFTFPKPMSVRTLQPRPGIAQWRRL